MMRITKLSTQYRIGGWKTQNYNVHTDVYSSFYSNMEIKKKMEATKMPFGRWMAKVGATQTMEYDSVLRIELKRHQKVI